jgi:hypothetical protein
VALSTFGDSRLANHSYLAGNAQGYLDHAYRIGTSCQEVIHDQ